MRVFGSRNWAFALALAGTASALFEKTIPLNSKTTIIKRNGASVTIFEHAETQSTMEYVSAVGGATGLCETTPGVKQYSGYLSVGNNMNMWFWFFESRKNPKTAPLAAWFNGGPGCSSMIGLFQENGPCTFNNGEPAGSPSRNQYSWNEHANMIYIDQPIGVGFSYGTNPVDSTTTAAVLVWKLLQAFYAKFPEYGSREFGIFTESYGGHYGPGFTKYILSQNAAIKKGTVKGQNINMVALGLNNAWINPYDNYKALIDYSVNNTYKKIITPAQAKQYQRTLDTRCLPALQNCWKSGTNSVCSGAVLTCKLTIEDPLSRAGSFDVYDIRKPKGNKWPPQTYEKWLQQPGIQQQVGAKQKFQECPTAPLRKFMNTGDDSRNYLPVLTEIVNANITVLLWAGDSDWICNWLGDLYTADDIKYPGQSKFKNSPLIPYKVKGKEKGSFKTVGNLSFLRVYAAGHTVPAFQPDISLQAFIQTMKKQPLSST